ncbi:MAG TPA: hypothetical protein VFC39_06075 [Acidobacteriaceae bacterium]|nr:hypothetical protein [Acidobacteriaceae bacterium]
MMHLTGEQMESTLSGRPPEEAARHLGGCAQCAGELATLREVFGDLREATAASAEHHRRFASIAGARRTPRMAWAMAAVVLFAAAATPFAMHHRQAPRVARVGAAASADATISDDALLDGVQNDLSTSVPASMLPLAGTSTSTTDSAADTAAAQRKNP